MVDMTKETLEKLVRDLTYLVTYKIENVNKREMDKGELRLASTILDVINAYKKRT